MVRKNRITKCQFCGEENFMDLHVCEGPKEFKCQKCNKSFAKLPNLESHKNSECPDSDQEQNDMESSDHSINIVLLNDDELSELQSNKKLSRDDKIGRIYICNKCEEAKFSDAEMLYIHKSNDKNSRATEAYHCNLCQETFFCKIDKMNHISDIHGYFFRDYPNPSQPLLFSDCQPNCQFCILAHKRSVSAKFSNIDDWQF